jgi:hypothetical protein
VNAERLRSHPAIALGGDDGAQHLALPRGAIFEQAGIDQQDATHQSGPPPPSCWRTQEMSASSCIACASAISRQFNSIVALGGRKLVTAGRCISSSGGFAFGGHSHCTGCTFSTGSGFGAQPVSASAQSSDAAVVIVADFIGDPFLSGDFAGDHFRLLARGLFLRFKIGPLGGDVFGFGQFEIDADRTHLALQLLRIRLPSFGADGADQRQLQLEPFKPHRLGGAADHGEQQQQAHHAPGLMPVRA